MTRNRSCSRPSANCARVRGIAPLALAAALAFVYPTPRAAADSAPDWLRAVAHEKLPDYPGNPIAVWLLDEYQTTVLEKGEIVISRDGPVVQPDELQDALGPENNIGRLWCDLVETVSGSSKDRLTVAQEWLRSHREHDRRSAKANGWTKNQERDRIIMNLLNSEMKPEGICQELDKRTIPTLPALQAKGVHRWVDGWTDPQAKKAIQQLLSKLPKR